MIEILYRKKLIRDVLNQYSTKQWNALIPILIEIGILFLKNNFIITELNIQDFKNILGKINKTQRIFQLVLQLKVLLYWLRSMQ